MKQFCFLLVLSYLVSLVSCAAFFKNSHNDVYRKAIKWALKPRTSTFFQFRRNAAAEAAYRRTLEDQIEILTRHVRLAKEEVRQLRSLIKSNSFYSRKETSQNAILDKGLREEMDVLLNQIKELQELKDNLEKLLDLERKKVLYLEKMILEEQNKSSQLKKEFEKEIEQLRGKLIEEIKVEKDRNERIKVESKKEMDKLRSNMLQEFRKQLEESSTSFQKQTDILKKKIKEEYEKKLNDEKKNCYDAVEREKSKMRKLVKVLAEKEKEALGKETLTRKSLSSQKNNFSAKPKLSM